MRKWELLVILLLILCLLPVFTLGAAEEKQQVVIGYNDLPGFLYQDENGNYSGFAYEVLQEIAAYNNWQFSYVQVPYQEIGTAFADGKIDLFIPYQKTMERELLFEYSDQVFCTNTASLFTRPEADLYYDDFAHFNGIKVGVELGTRNDQRFADFFEENGCTVTFVDDFLNTKQMKEALTEGRIDAFICASNRGVGDCRLICELETTDSYVLAVKGHRELLDKMDSALIQIRKNTPLFFSNMEEKYRMSDTGCYPALTREEVDYCARIKEITVLVGIQDMDAADGRLTGSIGQVLDLVTQYTGLTFVPKTNEKTSAIYDMLTNGQADILFAFDADYVWAQKHNARMTVPYASLNCIIAKRTGVTETNTMAVVNGTYIAWYAQQNRREQLIYFDTYKDCLEAVRTGKADCTILNATAGNYYATFPEYAHMVFNTMFDFSNRFCVAVSDATDLLLLSILDKAIAAIPKAMLNSLFDAQLNSRKTQLSDIFYQNPRLVIGVVLIAVLLVAIFAFAIVYAHMVKRKNALLITVNNAKTDFLSRVSHEMRTPMNGILGLTTLIRDKTDIMEIKQDVEQIGLSGKYLLNLINDTLDMNKIESGKLQMHVSKINSEEVFTNIYNNARILSDERNIKLVVHMPEIANGKWIPVMADASRLEQILMNLIANAVKYTPEGGTVEITMETLSVTEDIVKDRYIIRDTGIGMSEDFLPRIFEPFAQEGRKNTERENGTGLGLSIVKQLVDLMGGTISYKSKLNEGTEVTLEMNYPVYKGEMPRQEKADTSIDLLKDKKVLLCEDHPLNAQIARQLLAKKGVQVTVAANGQLGLDMFTASEPGSFDAVLMDMRMPVMDGITATQAIRALKRSDAKTVPIIAMTANAFDDDVKACLNAGMNDHLAKPVEPEKLFQTLANQIALAKDK